MSTHFQDWDAPEWRQGGRLVLTQRGQPAGRKQGIKQRGEPFRAA
jgi:hypothetical protein